MYVIYLWWVFRIINPVETEHFVLLMPDSHTRLAEVANKSSREQNYFNQNYWNF